MADLSMQPINPLRGGCEHITQFPRQSPTMSGHGSQSFRELVVRLEVR